MKKLWKIILVIIIVICIYNIYITFSKLQPAYRELISINKILSFPDDTVFFDGNAYEKTEFIRVHIKPDFVEKKASIWWQMVLDYILPGIIAPLIVIVISTYLLFFRFFKRIKSRMTARAEIEGMKKDVSATAIGGHDKEFRIFLKGENKTAYVEDYGYDEKGNCVVTFKGGKTYAYNAENVLVVDSALYNPIVWDCFEYLKHIAYATPIKDKKNQKPNYDVYNNFEKLKFIHPDGILGAFLSGNPLKPMKIDKKPLKCIYPFGFNVSQKKAIDQALCNPLSIIEGPPGTGKTQTILNIIANAIMRGETVAVVSNNNAATTNVFDKLESNGVGFITAALGSRKNKLNFINSQKPLPNIVTWRLRPRAAARMHKKLKNSSKKLYAKLLQQNELSKLKQELSAATTEQRYFSQFADDIPMPETSQLYRFIKNSDQALKMWLFCDISAIYLQKEGIISSIRSKLIKSGVFGKRKQEILMLLDVYPSGQLIAAYQRNFYELKISELTSDILELEHELKSFNFKEKMKECQDISLKLFRGKLYEKFASQIRKNFTDDDLWKNPEGFLNNYPVILSTTQSLRNSLSSRVMYDYVIIDEASQVNLCTGALALSVARKAVVVGDLKQLQHVVDGKESAVTDEIFSRFDLPEAYRYKNHSLLATMTELFPGAPHTLLREHYRCHPQIIEFCNQKFYDGQLIILTEPKPERNPLLVYKTVEGNHARDRMNQRQIDVIKNEIISQQSLNVHDNSLGIVTPYRLQTDMLQKAFDGMGVKADTVDKFQGQERDIIILSTVDNEITPFTDEANRLNVAISRAIDQLIVVVSDSDLKDTNIGDLVKYIEYNNFSIIESSIYSVFDYLYDSYADRRQKYLKKHKRVCENLMYSLIKTVLASGDGQFKCFDVAVHVPLKMIIRGLDMLTPSE